MAVVTSCATVESLADNKLSQVVQTSSDLQTANTLDPACQSAVLVSGRRGVGTSVSCSGTNTCRARLESGLSSLMLIWLIKCSLEWPQPHPSASMLFVHDAPRSQCRAQLSSKRTTAPARACRLVRQLHLPIVYHGQQLHVHSIHALEHPGEQASDKGRKKNDAHRRPRR
jgi:hypothetical protein